MNAEMSSSVSSVPSYLPMRYSASMGTEKLNALPASSAILRVIRPTCSGSPFVSICTSSWTHAMIRASRFCFVSSASISSIHFLQTNAPADCRSVFNAA